jgi:short-subunit dehydrogenase
MVNGKHYGAWALVAGVSEGAGASFAHKRARVVLVPVLIARKQMVLEDPAQ